MIQRIQSIWLFLASLLGFVFFFLPIAKFEQPVGYGFTFKVNGLIPSDGYMETLTNVYPSYFIWLLMILIIIAIILPFFTILKYKNRTQQLLLTRLGILIEIFLLVAMFLLADMISEKTGIVYQFNYFTAFAPIVSIIFLFLAMKGIQKDIKTLKEADRIR